jgi:hypothetical protein
MQISGKEILIGFIAIVIGILALIFNKTFARIAIEQQNKTWGFKFGHRDIIISRIVTIIVGTGFILWGISVLCHFTKV